MGLQKFDIVFDNPNRTYYAGQQVTGRVIVQLTTEKKLRGIALRFKGEAEVKWTESKHVTRNGKSETEYEHFRAHELYFEKNDYLVGSSHGEMRLTPGEYVYPFSYLLPTNVPSSLEGSYGHVRYTLKAKIDRPWKFDHECKAAFTVLTHLDLNAEDNMQEPVQSSKEKYLCCCCCRSGPITLVANVLRGFVPGQRIEAIIEGDNVTNEDVEVKCSLEKTVSYTARCGGRSHTKSNMNTIAVERMGRIGSRGSKNWTTNIEVPPLPPSYLKYCNCINISYRFVVKGKIPGPHNDIYLVVPVIIGTIPLRTYFPAIIPSAPVAPMVPTTPVAPVTPSYGFVSPPPPPSFNEVTKTPSAPPLDPLTTYPDMPPPSYEECMLSKGNIRSEEDGDQVHGAMEFAPRYPMYHFR